MSDSEKTPSYVGSSGSLALFTSEGKAVVIDINHNLVVESGTTSELSASKYWEASSDSVPAIVHELAEASLADLSINVIAASAKRLYTIPKGAQSEAKKALEWHAEHHRGGTPVGLNSARTLSKGGQIGIEKVRHIAKYFPRHEVDKKGKGWKPGEENFPSNGRIAWALWGGDTAWSWAQAIVERENKKTIKADAFMGPDLDSFKRAMFLDPVNAPEFLTRVRLDGSGMDRVYKIDIDGSVYVWDDGCWDDLGMPGSDIWALDVHLDDPEDLVEKSHIPIDPDSAIIICAKLQQEPFRKTSVFELDEEEAKLLAFGATELDWNFIDQTMVAAAGIDPNDNVYTPEERSQNATGQSRNALGRFAKTGQRVAIGGDGKQTGTIKSINGQNATVEMDSGQTVDVPIKSTQEEGTTKTEELPPQEDFQRPLDLSGIVGEPRDPINQPYAHMPGNLPAMTDSDVHDMLYNWSGWVQSQRNAAAELGFTSSGEDKEESDPKEEKEPDAYDHPLLIKWRKNKEKKQEQITDSGDWAGPVVATAALEDAAKTPVKTVALKTEAKKSYRMTPENSDVQPLYFAIVAEDDPRAVLDLVAIVPASSTSTDPMTYRRDKGQWVREPKLLNDLRSATPPPVIPLNTAVLNDVLIQVDQSTTTASGVYDLDHLLMVLWGPQREVIETYGQKFFDKLDNSNSLDDTLKAVFSMTAAGGLDRNSGHAEQLRRYWTVGKGASKIRWGTGGDWTRCVRNLSKYMGPRSQGYCSLRHKEMTGVWTGDKRHRQMYGRQKGGKSLFSTDLINTTLQVLEAAEMNAKLESAKERFGIVASGSEEFGPKFVIPLVIPEERESGDGRSFKKGAISVRELPIPLLWQIKTAGGHDGSVVVGKIEHIERVENGLGNATGVFDSGAHAKEVIRLIRNGFIRGISADMDQFEAKETKTSKEKMEDATEDQKELSKDKIVINKARIMAATIVPKPAFQECKIILQEDNTISPQEDAVIADGIYVDDVDAADAQALVACGMIAGSVPVEPPTSWFENPKLSGPTPLTVDDMGRVFGHIAAWHVDHIGMRPGTKPPRSKSNYAYFHTGLVRSAEGKDVPVGQLTLAGGHASLEASAMEAAKHYDDTASAIADVHAGEDQHGIWVAGSIRPSASPEQVRALRASAPSGDWRPIRGALELVAVCQVNVPGFPIARAMVSSGQIMALVAAGAATLAKLKSDPLAEMQARINKLEAITTPKEDLQARVASLKSKVSQTLSTDEFAYIPRDVRMKLAGEGKAMKDGSFPIESVQDVRAAIHAYGRAKDENKSAVRKHIIKRANKLNVRHLIPENWKTAASDAVTASANDLKKRVEAAQTLLAAGPLPAPFDSNDPLADAVPSGTEKLITTKEIIDGAEKPEDSGFKYTPGKNQPRDYSGRFRDVLARLSQNLGTSGNQAILDKIKEVGEVTGLGSYEDAAKAGKDLLGLLERLDEGTLNSTALGNVRATARELGKVISNMPLPFTNQAQKIRFSDLPPALRTLMENMVNRVEDKIGKKDAAEATSEVKGFMSGSDLYSQSDISTQMAKMLRLLT